jgi:ureidoglycolate lyase
MQMNTAPALRALPITTDGFAPYGWLVAADGHAGRAINDGSSLRVDDVGELDLTAQAGVPCLAVFRARARDPRGPWQTLERHRLGTQTFVPLAGTRCVVLVALGAEAPDPTTLAAFVVRGDQGVTLRAGTWHHGLLALDDGDFVVIERRAAEVDCDVATLPAPVTLQLA